MVLGPFSSLYVWSDFDEEEEEEEEEPERDTIYFDKIIE